MKKRVSAYEDIYKMTVSGLNNNFEAIEAVNFFYDRLNGIYDLLCPHPSVFDRYDCNYYAIDSDGEAWFYHKPTKQYKCGHGGCSSGRSYEGRFKVSLPLGVDWRLCRWSIRDAKRIWLDFQSEASKRAMFMANSDFPVTMADRYGKFIMSNSERYDQMKKEADERGIDVADVYIERIERNAYFNITEEQ